MYPVRTSMGAAQHGGAESMPEVQIALLEQATQDT